MVSKNALKMKVFSRVSNQLKKTWLKIAVFFATFCFVFFWAYMYNVYLYVCIHIHQELWVVAVCD